MKRQFPGLHAEADLGRAMFLKASSWFESIEPTIVGIRKNRSSFSASQSSNLRISPPARSRDDSIAPTSHSGN